MAKFIPYQKLTKKQQKLLNLEKRGTWGETNPVTRCAERSDQYNRKKENRRWQVEARKEHTVSGGFFADHFCACQYRCGH